MSTLADLVKSRRQSGQGVLGSLSSSLKDKIKETIDPRKFLNQSGLLTALFPKLKAFKAKPLETKSIESVKTTTNISLEDLQKSSDIAAKNSMVLPAMHRDMNVMRQNIVKLVKLEGGKPATKADMWFRKQKVRETEYEQKIVETKPQKKTSKKPTKEKESKTTKPSSAIPSVPSATPQKSLMGSIMGGVRSLGLGRVAAGTAVGTAIGLTALTARGESKGGDYNIVVGGSKENLTSMTLGEVLNFQDNMKKSKKYPSTAVGKYQIIQGTLKDAITKLGLNLNEKFDEKMQEKIFKEYLIGSKPGREGISAYINGKVPDTPENLQKAQMQLAMEFASYGVPRDVKMGEFNGWPKTNIKQGQSFYAGVAGNKASISPEDSAIALRQDRMRNEGKTVVPHPGTTPAGTPVPQPKVDGTKVGEASADVKREEEKPKVKTNVLIKENNNTLTKGSSGGVATQPEDLSRYFEERLYS